MQKRIGKAGKALFALIIIVVCVLPMSYFGVYRFSDFFICRAVIKQRLNISDPQLSIEAYIKQELASGSSQAEAKEVLQRIGEIRVVSSGSTMDAITEQINLKMCSHPLNNLIIFTNYSSEGKLISIKFPGD